MCASYTDCTHVQCNAIGVHVHVEYEVFHSMRYLYMCMSLLDVSQLIKVPTRTMILITVLSLPTGR